MIYNYLELPDEKIETEMWAFAYSTNNTEKSMGLVAKPYKCKFRGLKSYRYKREVLKIGNNGKPLKSGIVNSNARYYADSYEEACEEYNKLVDKQILLLQELISNCEGDKI